MSGYSINSTPVVVNCRIVLGVCVSGTNSVTSGVFSRGEGSELRPFSSTISGSYGIRLVCLYADCIVVDLNA